jgi:hypothetical protein
VLGVYLLTLARGLVGGDSPELITASRAVGIPHQPGYPLYVLLGRIFTFLPFGEIALRVNLMSSVAGAGAAAALAVWLRRTGLGTTASALLALAAGLSFTTWSQAIVAEVYTLGLFLGLGSILLFDAWRSGGSTRLLLLSAYVGGLAVGHQPLTVMLIPGVIVVLIRALRDGRATVRAAGLAAGLFALPFTIFAVLPIRSAAGPFVDYARIGSLGDFLYHALGLASRSELLGEGSTGVRHALDLIVRMGSREIGLPTALVTLAGLTGLGLTVRRDGERAVILGLPIALVLVFSLVYSIHDLENYFMLPFWLLVAFTGLVLARVEPAASPALGRGVLPVGIAALLVAGGALANRRACDRSGYRFIDDFVHNVLLCAPQNAALFLYTETFASPFAYRLGVRGERPDVRLVDMTGKVVAEPFGFREIRGGWQERRWRRMEELFLDPPSELRGRPFCSLLNPRIGAPPPSVGPTAESPASPPGSLELRSADGRRFEYRRRGLLFELLSVESPPVETHPYWKRLVIRMPRPEILHTERIGFTLTPYIRRFYAATGLAAAEELAQAGRLAAAIETYRDLFDLVPHSTLRKRIADLQARAGDVDAAERELRLAIESNPNDADALNALGVVVLNRGDARGGEALLRRAVAVDPDFALARLNLGQLLVRDPRRAAEAIVHLEAFLRLAPGDSEAVEVRETLAGLRGVPAGGREIP